MFHFKEILKTLFAVIAFLAVAAVIPCARAEADVRLGAERCASYDTEEGRLYDEMGRIDFRTVSTGKTKAADVEETIPGGNVKKTVVENEDWRITLLSAKTAYSEGEAVDVRASLEYIGKGKSKEVQVCDPILGFYVESSTGTVICQYAAYSSSDPGSPKTFKKGKTYEVKLDVTGQDLTNLCDMDMEKAVELLHDKDGKLILPKGTYTIKAGMTDRASKRGTNSRKNAFFATLHINVGVEGEIFAVGNDLFRTLGDNEAVLIGNTADAKLFSTGDIEGEAWDIPASVEYKGKKRSVTVIGDDGMVIESMDPDDGSIYYERYGGFYGKVFSSIHIPSSVKKISKYALAGVHGMNEVRIDAKKLDIANEAFAGCSWGIASGKPGKLIISAATLNIAKRAFYGCSLLQDISIKATKSLKIRDEAFAGCYNLLKVKLPEKTTYLGDRAFYDCGMDKKLTITIPSGVRHIGEALVNRAAVKVAPGNKAYKEENGLLISADGKTVVRVMSRKQKEIVVPDGATTILAGAFAKSKAESLIIPDSVTSIPDEMIYGDSKLKTVKLGSGITSIGKNAFYNSGLTKLVIPASVKTIGEGAFCYSKKLAKVTLKKGLEEIADRAFAGCYKIKSLVIPNTVKSVGRGFAPTDYVRKDPVVTFKSGNPAYEQDGFEVFEPGTGDLKVLIVSDQMKAGELQDTDEWVKAHFSYATRLSERVKRIGDTKILGYVNYVAMPAGLESLDVAFLPSVCDNEEGGTLIFVGEKPPKITNSFDTRKGFWLTVVVKRSDDVEAYRKAFADAGLGKNQSVTVLGPDEIDSDDML
ncbi:MAG: leucine-rich repeat domain-containing protein [Lachnospiraceae bacterium]|nr:leucine-rich repeat domain-containing protein [Lachnospiraceae bacterium]